MSEKISAIVPVYNTPDKFFKLCVESLINQSYKNIEILLIDDGSNKTTADMCDRFAEKDERIVVIHQENKGPSAARNLGLLHATGDFITFVDSDDILRRNSWEVCINKINHYNADCLVFGWVDNCKKPPETINVAIGSDKVLTANKAIETIAAENEKCGGGYPWNKVWRKSSILLAYDSIPEFDLSLFAYEDKEWIIRCLQGLNNVVLIQDVLYEYQYVETSLTNSAEKWAIRQYNAYYAYDKIMEELKDVDYNAYCAAINFYFGFGFRDLYEQLKHPRLFGGFKRIRKTKKHMYLLCKKVQMKNLKGYKRKVLWLIMQIWGML